MSSLRGCSLVTVGRGAVCPEKPSRFHPQRGLLAFAPRDRLLPEIRARLCVASFFGVSPYFLFPNQIESWKTFPCCPLYPGSYTHFMNKRAGLLQDELPIFRKSILGWRFLRSGGWAFIPPRTLLPVTSGTAAASSRLLWEPFRRFLSL